MMQQDSPLSLPLLPHVTNINQKRRREKLTEWMKKLARAWTRAWCAETRLRAGITMCPPVRAFAANAAFKNLSRPFKFNDILLFQIQKIKYLTTTFW